MKRLPKGGNTPSIVTATRFISDWTTWLAETTIPSARIKKPVPHYLIWPRLSEETRTTRAEFSASDETPPTTAVSHFTVRGSPSIQMMSEAADIKCVNAFLNMRC